MHFIKTKEEYYNHITRNCTSEEDKQKIIEKAYEVALETRKFEIELYWKRATYFWAFIGAIFVAYFALLSSDNLQNVQLLTIPLSLLGIIFSLGWLFVNRGSKLWQENWESNISFLEDYITGPLFKNIVIPNMNMWSLTKSYPYSVSKVNIILSIVTVIFWFILLIFSVVLEGYRINILSFLKDIPYFASICYLIVTILALIVISIGLKKIHTKSRSFIYKDLKEKEVPKNAKIYFNGDAPNPSHDQNRTNTKSFFFGLIKF